jgi:hypothetical protein
MIFCHKNILEHAPSFYGAYKKICLLTPGGQSDIVTHQTYT